MKELEERLEYTSKKSDELLMHFNASSGNDTHFFCLYMLERLNFSTLGLQTIYKDLFSKTQLEYSAGIIVRTVLLDYMIVLNTHVIIDENINKDIKEVRQKVDSFCTTMLSDCINHTLRDIDRLKIPKEDLKKLYKGIASMYPESFETYKNDGTRPVEKVKGSFRTTKLFENLFNSKSLRTYSDVYQAYLFYSKYDHFGRMYYDFLGHDFKDRLQRLNESVKVFPRMLMFVVVILLIIYPDDQYLLDEFEKIKTFNNTY
jgi:hypothetical protein